MSEWVTPEQVADGEDVHRTTVRHKLNQLYYSGVAKRKIKDDKTRLYCVREDVPISDIVDTGSVDELLTTL